MKNRVKQIAAGTFIAFLLLAGNVKSEGTEIKSSVTEVIETSLQLESWMTAELILISIPPVILVKLHPHC